MKLQLHDQTSKQINSGSRPGQCSRSKCGLQLLKELRSHRALTEDLKQLCMRARNPAKPICGERNGAFKVWLDYYTNDAAHELKVEAIRRARSLAIHETSLG